MYGPNKNHIIYSQNFPFTLMLSNRPQIHNERKIIFQIATHKIDKEIYDKLKCSKTKKIKQKKKWFV